MRYALILGFLIRLAAASEPDPSEVLSRVVGKVLAATKHMPNYTCVETVDRQYFRPAAATLPRACSALLDVRRHPTLDMVLRRIATDRLRLDVTMVQRGEIFSWVGASKFDDTEIDHVVRSGPMGTGLFGGLLAVVFESDVKKFVYQGKKVVDGRSLLEYSFEVPQLDSHYKVKAGNSWIFTAYVGTIRLDPETDDLVGMSVQTAELPLATYECMAIIDLDLGWVQIGDVPFLLPKLAHQRFVAPTGDEVENTAAFTGCREYRGESTVRFGEAPPTPAGKATRRTRAKVTVVPAGSRLSFELTTPIDSAVAAAGDSFTGKLRQPLRSLDGHELAPIGTTVEGHLLRMESHTRPPEILVVLRPEALRIGGERVPLAASPDFVRTMNDARSKDRMRMEFTLPEQGEEHAGVFRFPGEHSLVPKGFQSDWRTLSTSTSDQLP